MSDTNKAVFLSYVSQDAEFARRIAGALRSTGVNVWMDRGASAEGELRAQIAACGVFMPVISANTQARLDGQFRLEWRLAGQQVRTAPAPRSFLLPIVIDATGDAEARVPAEFKSVPWTRMPDGEASPAFCARVRRLLPSSDAAAEDSPDSDSASAEEKKTARSAGRSRWHRRVAAAVLLALLAAGGGAYWWRLPSNPATSSNDAARVTAEPAAAQPAGGEVAREEPRALAQQAQRLIDSPGVDAERLWRADALCRRALALGAADPEILTTASLASQALYALDYDASPRRLALARDYADQAVRLDPDNFRARLAQVSGERVADRDARADGLLALIKKRTGGEPAKSDWEARAALKRRPHREDPVDPAREKRAPDAASETSPPAVAKHSSAEATRVTPAAPADSANSPAKREEKSLAVLSFENSPGDATSAGVAEALSEEVLNALAKTPGLKITARTSALYFKGKAVPRAEIARQLGVDYLVEGRVRHAEGKLTVTAQLIKAADGVPSWSETFARDVKDVLAVEDNIARGVAERLALKPSARSKPRPAVNLTALELYLRGRRQWNLRTPESLARAEKLFEQALVIDPDFARAHTGLADAWAAQAALANRTGRRDQRGAPELARVRERIELALRLDPELAEAHASLGGNVRFENWDFAGAESALRRAIELNPGYAPAYQWLAWALVSQGRADEALAAARESAERDPLSARILDNYGLVLGHAGRPAEQLAAYRRALAVQPDAAQAQAGLPVALARLGRFDEALGRARALPEVAARAYAEAAVMRLAGRPVKADLLLGVFGGEPGILLTATRLLLERNEDALALLQAPAADARGLGLLLFDPLFDPIRDDPRFAGFLASIEASEAHARAQAWRKAHPSENTDPKP